MVDDDFHNSNAIFVLIVLGTVVAASLVILTVNGSLVWWIDGLEYHIASRMPLNQILRIANSMC